MKKHSNIIFEIRCHTDYRDSDIRNQVRSMMLAVSFKYYFEINGIDSSRIKAKGMGEYDPFIIGKCFHSKYHQFEIGDTLNEKYIKKLKSKENQETARYINRRNEIVIVEIRD